MPTDTETCIFVRFMTMREKQILRAIEIPKENWGLPHIFQRLLSNNISKKRQWKYKAMYGSFSQIQA